MHMTAFLSTPPHSLALPFFLPHFPQWSLVFGKTWMAGMIDAHLGLSSQQLFILNVWALQQEMSPAQS